MLVIKPRLNERNRLVLERGSYEVLRRSRKCMRFTELSPSGIQLSPARILRKESTSPEALFTREDSQKDSWEEHPNSGTLRSIGRTCVHICPNNNIARRPKPSWEHRSMQNATPIGLCRMETRTPVIGQYAPTA